MDECRTTGSQSEALMAMLHEHCDLPKARIAAQDSFIATGTGLRCDHAVSRKHR